MIPSKPTSEADGIQIEACSCNMFLDMRCYVILKLDSWLLRIDSGLSAILVAEHPMDSDVEWSNHLPRTA